MNPFDLTGERALITGGTSGLGLEMARCFRKAGAEVIVTGRNPDFDVSVLSGEAGPPVYYKAFDVSETDKTDRFVQDIEQTIGPVSVLVNNAGNHVKKPVEATTDSDFMTVLQVHVMGAFALTRAVIPGMKRARKGCVIFQASMSSFIGVPNVIAYSAAKSAYLGMVRGLAAEVSADGIRVNAIAPGWIETPMLAKALAGDPERAAKILGRTPMNRFGQAEDIGWAGVYLASPAARFVNGVVLPVDGGALIGF